MHHLQDRLAYSGEKTKGWKPAGTNKGQNCAGREGRSHIAPLHRIPKDGQGFGLGTEVMRQSPGSSSKDKILESYRHWLQSQPKLNDSNARLGCDPKKFS